MLISRCCLARGHGELRHSCGSALAHQVAARRRPFGLPPHPRDGAKGGRFASPPDRPPTPRHPCPCCPPRRSPTWLRPCRRAHAPCRAFFQVAIGSQLHFGHVSRVERSRSGACSRGAPRQADLPPRPSRPCEGSPWPPRKRPPNAPRVGPPARRRELGGYVRICSPDHQPRTHSVSSQGLVQCV